MSTLGKAQFEMLHICAAFLRAANKTAPQPSSLLYDTLLTPHITVFLYHMLRLSWCQHSASPPWALIPLVTHFSVWTACSLCQASTLTPDSPLHRCPSYLMCVLAPNIRPSLPAPSYSHTPHLTWTLKFLIHWHIMTYPHILTTVMLISCMDLTGPWAAQILV